MAFIVRKRVKFRNRYNQVPHLPQINKTNTSVNGVAFLDLNLSISNDIVSTKMYDFEFEIVNFPF